MIFMGLGYFDLLYKIIRHGINIAIAYFEIKSIIFFL